MHLLDRIACRERAGQGAGSSRIARGGGREFGEVSPYQIGGDGGLIDWNVSARYGEPFIKKFREERELTVMLVIDASRSGLFGSTHPFKLAVAAGLGGVLAFS